MIVFSFSLVKGGGGEGEVIQSTFRLQKCKKPDIPIWSGSDSCKDRHYYDTAIHVTSFSTHIGGQSLKVIVLTHLQVSVGNALFVYVFQSKNQLCCIEPHLSQRRVKEVKQLLTSYDSLVY